MMSAVLLTAGMTVMANSAAALTEAGFPSASAVDILQEMPQDAQLVVLTKPLDGISTKADRLVKMLGLPLAPPEEQINIAQLLGMALAGEGLMVEIDSTRPLGLAAPQLENLDKMPLIYLPVKDALSKIETLETLVKVPEAENIWCCKEDVYVKPVGDYLIMTEELNLLTDLAQKPKGVKLSPADQNLIDQSDVALFVKVGAVMPMLRQQALLGLAQEPDLQQHPSIVKFLTLVVSRFCEFEQAGVGLSLLEEGISLKLSGQAQADTNLARYFSNHPKTSVSVMNKLPAGEVIEAFAIQFDPKLINGPIQALLDALVADPTVSEKINPDDLKALRTNFTKMMELSYSEPVAVGMYMPKELGAGDLKVIELYTMSNAEEAFQLYPQLFPLITKIVEQAGFNLPITYKKDAGTVEGYSYDEMTVDLSYLPLPPEVLQLYAQMFGGKAAITEQICKLDNNLYAATMGKDCLPEAVALAKDKTGTLDKNPGIAKTAQHLPSQANVMFFLDLGNYPARDAKFY